MLRASRTDPAGEILLYNPADCPDPSRIETIEEPWIKAVIYTPDEYLGSILKLCQDRRGIQTDLTYVCGRASRSRRKFSSPRCGWGRSRAAA